MGRTHDVVISGFDLDRLEADLAAAERAAAEQARRANENHAWALRAERERDQYRGLLIRLYNDLFVHHKGEALREFKELFREENYN